MEKVKGLQYGIILVLIIVIIEVIFFQYRYDMQNIYDQDNLITEDKDTFDLEVRNQDIENNTYKADYRLDGYGLIWTYNSDEDEELTVPYTLNVLSGKAKIVLINEDNKITTLIETNNRAKKIKQSKLKLKIKPGLNRIKIVGYKADLEMKMRINRGEFKAIGFD